MDRLTEASSKASSSGVGSSGQKAANADTSSKAKAVVGGNRKSPSSQPTGKSTQSTNGSMDGKTGGGKSKNSRDAQKQNQAPDPVGKTSNAASEAMGKEDANGKEPDLGKTDAQRNSEPAEKGFQKNEEGLTVSENQETQVRKQDS